METELPAVALAAVPGRRRRTLDLAREVERRGFGGIYCASFGDGLGLCEALAFATERIPIGTAIANLYVRNPFDYAQTASLIHELSGGRFHFGVGVSHDAMNRRLGLATGKPLADARDFGERFPPPPRGGARCRRSCSPRCAARWSRWPARSPTVSCSRTWRARTSRPRSGRCRRRSAPTRPSSSAT